MEFPFGHHHHKPHNREEEEYPPPSHHHQPPPNYPPPGAGYPPPPYQQPPPPHYNVYQDPQPDRFNPNPMGVAYPQPPPPAYGYGSAPGYPPVQHVSHEYGNPAYEPDRPQYPHEHHHHHGGPGPIPPPSVYHESHQGGSSELLYKPTVRVYSKAEVNYSLTIREGKVILARSDPSDRFQHWIKDLKYSTKVKDEEGFPSFALVNQATGQALKHSIGATHPVQLTPYNPNVLDESVLWTESKDLGDTYRCIRMVNNIRLNLDALNGDKNHGGVHDGTIAVLWEWKKGDNQRWKIAPYWWWKIFSKRIIGRVAAGALAKIILKAYSGTEVLAYVSQAHKVVLPDGVVDPEILTLDQIESNIIRCPDPEYAEKMIVAIDVVQVKGDYVGGVVTCIARNVPLGLGSPVFHKLEAELAKASLSLLATKGFEFGSGFAGTILTGSEHNDEFYTDDQGRIRTRTNRSGGIQKKQKTVTREKQEIDLIARGHHDPCVVPRAVPMVALVLVDQLN